ncbi:MAG: hypothetical protein FVQ80_03915 [Planctomycetes bacterium]|nr:hypothetical protein [Planctomycetota bacterium]
MDSVDRIAELLLHLSGDESVDFGEIDRALLAGVRCSEIALAQQKILDAGLEVDELRLLWKNNRGVLPDLGAKLRGEIEDGHILQRVLAEHEMVLCFISDLNEVNSKIQQLDYGSSSTEEIRRLAHIVGHLVSSEQHCEREEQVIFPELDKCGFYELLKVVSYQHSRISKKYHVLNSLIWDVDDTDFDKFKSRLEELTGYLVAAVRTHVFIETNVIYPLALELISDKKVWARMKGVCNQIGYCGFDAC